MPPGKIRKPTIAEGKSKYLQRKGKDYEGGVFHPPGAVMREFMPRNDTSRGLYMDPDEFMRMRTRKRKARKKNT